jgi:hypothetical protein
MKQSLFVLALLLLAAGCSTAPAPADFPVSPRMASAYSDGATTITWKALPEQTYTIYYTDAPPGKLPGWKPLPQATGLRGNGQQISICDQAAESRRYMLLSGSQTPY